MPIEFNNSVSYKKTMRFRSRKKTKNSVGDKHKYTEYIFTLGTLSVCV